MSNINIIKKEISELLLKNPVDVRDINGEIYNVPEWETFSIRECIDFENEKTINSRKIGSANILEALEYLAEECINNLEEELSNEKLTIVNQLLFQDLLELLEKDKIIRKNPVFKRKEIKLVVDNTIKK